MFQSIEFDDDRADDIEIEGWMGQDWFVELDLNGNGDIERVIARTASDEPTIVPDLWTVTSVVGGGAASTSCWSCTRARRTRRRSWR